MIFEEFATKLNTKYGMFLFSLSGAYQQALAENPVMNMAAISTFFTQSVVLGKAFLDIAKEQIADYVALMSVGVRQEAQNSIQLESETLLRSLQTAVALNIELAKSGLAKARTKSGHKGIFAELAKRKLSKVDFTLTDSAGRSWEAVKLIGVVGRDFAYQAYLSAEFDRMSAAGQDIVDAVPPVADHHSKDVVFSISGNVKGMPTLEAIRAKLFHPNSRVTVKPHDTLHS